MLNEWLVFRTATVTKRLQARLEKVLARLHILDGYLIAYLNLDAVIAIIREEEDPKAVLMQKFNLTIHKLMLFLELKLRLTHITGILIVLLTTALRPKNPNRSPARIDRQAATYPAGWS